MKKSENFFQKLFTGLNFGSSRIPLRSNIWNNGTSGYSRLGSNTGRFFDNERESPLLGNYSVGGTRISSYFERMSEVRGYANLDIVKLCVNFFSDYIVNFLRNDGQQVVTVLNEDSTNNENITERINNILLKDLDVLNFIRDHINDYVYYGTYASMILCDRDSKGHLVFRIEELYNPNSIVIKRVKDKDTGLIKEIFLAIGDDGNLYEIPDNEVMYISNPKLRLQNDLEEGWKEKRYHSPKKGDNKNRDKVIRKESFIASEPLFYSSLIKLKELSTKELLIALITLRDLISPSLFAVPFDKNTPLEAANSLVAKMQKLFTNYGELSSFLTAQFDVTSLIESALVQNVKCYADYNQSMSSKSPLYSTDKLSDKLLDLMQTLDSSRANILSVLGLPTSILDGTSGSKWAVLQQSERANSKVSSFITGIKDSVVSLVCSIYKTIYGTDLDKSLVQLHLFSKTTTEFNAMLNESEAIGSLIQGISGVLTTSLQTLEQSSPLIDPDSFLSYIKNLLKDIDPNTEGLINEDTIKQYIDLLNQKLQAQKEQLGIS